MIKELYLNIWERDFTLPVIFDCFDDEAVTKEQIEAVNNFSKHLIWIEKAKKEVKKFCNKDVVADVQNLKKDNIFSYVKPEGIFVKREEKNPRIAIMCKYKYDLEHGLAIVFSFKGEIKVGIQDIIL